MKNSLFEPPPESLDQSKSFFHFREYRNMTHLSSGAGFPLSIEMELARGSEGSRSNRALRFPKMSKKVPHHDRA